MKKRILALTLCLVMAVSLLPITAAAIGDYRTLCFTKVCITGTGLDYVGGKYDLKNNDWTVEVDGNNCSAVFKGELLGLYQDAGLTNPVTGALVEGETYYLGYQVLGLEGLDSQATVSSDLSSAVISLTIPGFTASYDSGEAGSKDMQMYCKLVFKVTKNHEHSWRFDTSENSLTATCTPGCPIGTVDVNLTAHSVTLPDSPFNAEVKISENFRTAFPNAQISGPYYYYNESGTFTKVDPDTFTPKAGQYQAQVYIDGLPGNKEVATRALSTDDGVNPVGSHVDLWVDYTAADPKVTAQTGDNRPVEIMMACAAVFSLLAIAAFVLDNKRRYSR